mgnify:CR=1 FL=1
MMMKKRSFTKEEKLKIIKEASEKGVNETLEKYGIYRTSYYDWKKNNQSFLRINVIFMYVELLDISVKHSSTL